MEVVKYKLSNLCCTQETSAYVIQQCQQQTSRRSLPFLTFMAGTSQPRLRHRRASADHSNIDYDHIQDDEHVGEVFQNPVRVTSLSLRVVAYMNIF